MTLLLAGLSAIATAWAADPAVIVSGTLTIDAARADTVSRAKALFVSVRDPAGGPPLAALKLAPGPFPLTFQVTEANAIPMGGVARPFPEKVDLSIRLDEDGDPLSKDDLPAASLPGTAKGTTEMKVKLQ